MPKHLKPINYLYKYFKIKRKAEMRNDAIKSGLGKRHREDKEASPPSVRKKLFTIIGQEYPVYKKRRRSTLKSGGPGIRRMSFARIKEAALVNLNILYEKFYRFMNNYTENMEENEIIRCLCLLIEDKNEGFYPSYQAKTKLKWLKMSKVQHLCFMENDIAVLAKGCFFLFYDMNKQAKRTYKVNDMVEGEKIECFDANQKHSVVAYSGTKSYRITLFKYPSLHRVMVLKDDIKDDYIKLAMGEQDILYALRGTPSFRLSIWNWRSGEVLYTVPNAIFTSNVLLKASPVGTSCLIIQSLRNSYISKYSVHMFGRCCLVDKIEIDYEPRMVIDSVCYSNTGTIYLTNQDATLFTIDDHDELKELEKWKLKNSEVEILKNATNSVYTQVIWYLFGLLVVGPSGYIRYYEVSERKITPKWEIKREHEPIRLATNCSSTKVLLHCAVAGLCTIEKQKLAPKINFGSGIKYMTLLMTKCRYLLTAGERPEVQIWNLATGDLVNTLYVKIKVGQLDSNPIYPYIMCAACDSGKFRLIDLKKVTNPVQLMDMWLSDEPLPLIQFCHDGDGLLAVTPEWRIFLIKGNPTTKIEFESNALLGSPISSLVSFELLSTNSPKLMVLDRQPHVNGGSRMTMLRIPMLTVESIHHFEQYYIKLEQSYHPQETFYALTADCNQLHKFLINSYTTPFTYSRIGVIQLLYILPKINFISTPYHLVTYGIDGLIFFWDDRNSYCYHVSMNHHRFDGGTRKVVIDLESRRFVSLGYDGVIACCSFTKKLCNHEDHQLPTTPHYTPPAYRRRRSTIAEYESNNKPWTRWFADYSAQLDEKKFKEDRARIFKDLEEIKKNYDIYYFLNSNQQVVEARLELHELCLNQGELRDMFGPHLNNLKQVSFINYKKNEFICNKLYNDMKVMFWDPMDTHLLLIKAFRGNYYVANFVIREMVKKYYQQRQKAKRLRSIDCEIIDRSPLIPWEKKSLFPTEPPAVEEIKKQVPREEDLVSDDLTSDTKTSITSASFDDFLAAESKTSFDEVGGEEEEEEIPRAVRSMTITDIKFAEALSEEFFRKSKADLPEARELYEERSMLSIATEESHLSDEHSSSKGYRSEEEVSHEEDDLDYKQAKSIRLDSETALPLIDISDEEMLMSDSEFGVPESSRTLLAEEIHEEEIYNATEDDIVKAAEEYIGKEEPPMKGDDVQLLKSQTVNWGKVSTQDESQNIDNKLKGYVQNIDKAVELLDAVEDHVDYEDVISSEDDVIYDYDIEPTNKFLEDLIAPTVQWILRTDPKPPSQQLQQVFFLDKHEQKANRLEQAFFHYLCGDQEYATNMLEANSPLNAETLIPIMKETISKLKRFFNSKMEEAKTAKIKTLEYLEQLNTEIRDLIEALRDSCKLPVKKLPPLPDSFELSSCEVPERMISVEDSEIQARKYISPSQQALIDAELEKQLEYERLLASDTFMRDALMAMMDGVVELRWQDILKKEVPVPQFMIKKPPEFYTAEEIKEEAAYRRKVKDLAQQRVYYVDIAKNGIQKVYARIKLAQQYFDKQLRKLAILRHEVETGVTAERLKILRICEKRFIQKLLLEYLQTLRNWLYEEQLFSRELSKYLSFLRQELQIAINKYDNAKEYDEKLEIKFRKALESNNVNPLHFDKVLKLYNQRPHLLDSHKLTPALLHDMAHIRENPSRENFIPDNYLNYFRVLDTMDDKYYCPDGINMDVWALIKQSRRDKIKSEFEFQALRKEVLAGKKALKYFEGTLFSCYEQFDELRAQLVNVQQNLREWYQNYEIQFFIPGSHIDIKSTGTKDQYQNSVFVEIPFIDDVNVIIRRVCNVKKDAIKNFKQFMREIGDIEFEHIYMKCVCLFLTRELQLVRKASYSPYVKKYLDIFSSTGKEPIVLFKSPRMTYICRMEELNKTELKRFEVLSKEAKNERAKRIKDKRLAFVLALAQSQREQEEQLRKSFSSESLDKKEGWEEGFEEEFWHEDATPGPTGEEFTSSSSTTEVEEEMGEEEEESKVSEGSTIATLKSHISDVEYENEYDDDDALFNDTEIFTHLVPRNVIKPFMERVHYYMTDSFKLLTALAVRKYYESYKESYSEIMLKRETAPTFLESDSNPYICDIGLIDEPPADEEITPHNLMIVYKLLKELEEEKVATDPDSELLDLDSEFDFTKKYFEMAAQKDESPSAYFYEEMAISGDHSMDSLYYPQASVTTDQTLSVDDGPGKSPVFQQFGGTEEKKEELLDDFIEPDDFRKKRKRKRITPEPPAEPKLEVKVFSDETISLNEKQPSSEQVLFKSASTPSENTENNDSDTQLTNVPSDPNASIHSLSELNIDSESFLLSRVSEENVEEGIKSVVSDSISLGSEKIGKQESKQQDVSPSPLEMTPQGDIFEGDQEQPTDVPDIAALHTDDSDSISVHSSDFDEEASEDDKTVDPYMNVSPGDIRAQFIKVSTFTQEENSSEDEEDKTDTAEKEDSTERLKREKLALEKQEEKMRLSRSIENEVESEEAIFQEMIEKDHLLQIVRYEKKPAIQKDPTSYLEKYYNQKRESIDELGHTIDKKIKRTVEENVALEAKQKEAFEKYIPDKVFSKSLDIWFYDPIECKERFRMAKEKNDLRMGINEMKRDIQILEAELEMLRLRKYPAIVSKKHIRP